MALCGKVGDGGWSVSAVAHPATGGFDCSIQLSHTAPEGEFTHEFRHSRIFPTERDAVLAGLREGMVWLQLKMSKTLSVQPPEKRQRGSTGDLRGASDSL